MCIRDSYRMEHRAPNGGARECTQGAEGVCNPIAEDGLVGHHWEERPLGLMESLGSFPFIH